MISQLFAVWFVVLIVLPFTAPFQTFDLTAPTGTTDAHGVVAAHKLSAKDTTTATLTPAVVPYLVTLTVPNLAVSRNHSRRQDRPTVLRL
jgi:hypothetical protein